MSTTGRGFLNANNAYYILKKYWDPRVGDNVRNMKAFRDGTGVVFDIRSDQCEKFMANLDRLKETQSDITFDISKCTELPDLEDEQGYGNNQNWRDQGNSGYSRGGRGGGGGYQSRGGYDNNRGGGGGGWDRNNNDRGYGGGGGRDYGSSRGGGYGDDNSDSLGGNWRDQNNNGGYQRRGGYQ